jgi:hypothetical protein
MPYNQYAFMYIGFGTFECKLLMKTKQTHNIDFHVVNAEIWTYGKGLSTINTRTYHLLCLNYLSKTCEISQAKDETQLVFDYHFYNW